VSLFDPIVADADPIFLFVRDRREYSPARRLMEHVFTRYPGPKKEFIRNFQTHGFAARIWELSLFAYLDERHYHVEITRGPPDYLVTDTGVTVAIEATTTNPPRNPQSYAQGVSAPEDASKQRTWEPLGQEDIESLQQELIRQVAKALGRKMQPIRAEGLYYWQLPQVAGHLFVLAVEAFHAEAPLFLSSAALIPYFYGWTHKTHHTETGLLTVTPMPVASHKVRDKSIPSGFFSQPKSEHISGVLFSNAATINQFQRIAIELGSEVPGIKVLREGWCYDHDPDADVPKPFLYEATPHQHRETFAQGLTLFHNPVARYPIPLGFFRDICEGWLTEERTFAVRAQPFTPLTSITHFIKF
jgi:hypothetical protein